MQFDRFATAYSGRLLQAPARRIQVIRWACRLALPAFVVAMIADPAPLLVLDRAALFFAPLAWLYMERLTARQHGVSVSRDGLTLEPAGPTILAEDIADISHADEAGQSRALRVTLRRPGVIFQISGAIGAGHRLFIPLAAREAPTTDARALRDVA